VLERTLPAGAYRFLTASTDRFTKQLLGKELAPEPAVPARELQQLALAGEWSGDPLLASTAGEARRGSNAWVVAGSRTRDGRALLANDMHLDLGVPNVWYRAALRYADVSLDGVFLPGVPALIAGSNQHVAWGLTSLEADALDLVELEQDATRPNAYRTPDGLRDFTTRTERIAVRGAEPVELQVRSTIWGPVTLKPLLGKAVAVRWSALDATAVGIELMDLDRARGVDQAMETLTRARGPACNVLLADEHGKIGWTVTGRIPQRQGFDGATSASWADGKHRWLGYVAPSALPRLRTPESGVIVNANQRVPVSSELVLSHDYSNGSRALRITQRLAGGGALAEKDMLAIQLDTQAIFFDFYRDVVSSVRNAAPKTDGVLARALSAVASWDGKAEPSSVGLGLLVRFRKRLAETLLSPLIARCRHAEPTFEYTLDFDAPLERLLSERAPELLPQGAKSWDAFLLSMLEQAARELEAEHPNRAVPELTWGEQNRVVAQHPLGALPDLGALNMPAEPLPGCGFCVRVASGALGATERLVVAPAREKDAIFHMPGGQSGNPGSPHYRDQQRAWLEGLATPLLAGPATSSFSLSVEAAGLGRDIHRESKEH
jgi:penicillin G amidase